MAWLSTLTWLIGSFLGLFVALARTTGPAWLKQVEDLANSPVTLEPPELTATLKAAQALNQAPPVLPATGGQS